MTTIQINNRNFTATTECANVLRNNSDSNEVMSMLINISLLTGALIEL